MRPNWFLALPVPAEPWLAERVPPPPAPLKAIGGSDLHLTVAFLGACGEERARRAWEGRGDWRLGATRVRLGEVVAMGKPRRYSALSALLSAGARELEEEIARCRPAWLAAAGARPDRRPPRAHLTLARPPRGASGAEREAGLAWARGLELEDIELGLDELALYTWSAERPARLFRVVESLRLEAR